MLAIFLLITGLTLISDFLAERYAPSYRLWPHFARWFRSSHQAKDIQSGVQQASPKSPQLRDQAPKDHLVQSGKPNKEPQEQTSEPEKKELLPEPPKPIQTRRSNATTAPLLALWTPAQLRGQPGDEVIRSRKPPDHSPPEQKEPEGELPTIQLNEQLSIRRVRIPHGQTPVVALTFDLCEQADDVTGYDREIVNTLRDQDVRATFFAGGKWLRSHPEKAMQLMADPRFEIGNHGWTHGNLRVLSGKRMVDQIVWTQAEYQRLWHRLAEKAEVRGLGDAMRVPFQPRTLRFPYGTCSPESLQTVNNLGLTAIQWDVVSGDAAKGQSPENMARRVVEQVKPGSIVVMHANGRGQGTATALPKILDGLRKKGYQFATVSDLLQQGEPVTSAECYELRPGDNKKYDAIFGEGTE